MQREAHRAIASTSGPGVHIEFVDADGMRLPLEERHLDHNLTPNNHSVLCKVDCTLIFQVLEVTQSFSRQSTL